MQSQSERSELAQVVAARLRELRARLDLTQEEVSRSVGCHESALSRWESGSRLPACTDILALARFYRVSCDDLLGRREQHVMAGAALIDQGLLDRLAVAQSAEDFDRIVEEAADQAAWLPVGDASVVVPVSEAMRRAREIADRFPNSRFGDRLFRPRV